MVFKHKDPGAELTQAEFIAACGDGHIFACQATGDIVYASSATILTKLARGAAGTVLSMGCSCIPAWTTNAASSTVASTVVVVDGTDTSSFVAIFDSATGSLAPKTDAGLAYNAGTGMLTATGFTGPITLPANKDISFTGTTGTNDVVLTNGLADALSITDGSADVVVVDTSTAGNVITFTSALTVGVCATGHDVKFFGDTAGAYMLYDQSEDHLEIRGASADATTSTGKLLLTTAQTAVAANDVIGSISFQAPLETGTDAVKVSASITAVAQGTFAANVNATDIIFNTAHDNCVAERFRFTSQGEIGIAGANYGTDGQVLTSTGGGTAVAWEDAGGGVVSGGTDNAILRADGTGGSTSQNSAVTIADTTGSMTFPAAARIFLGDGNAANPSYGFLDDGNAGMTIAIDTVEEIALVHNGVFSIRANGHNVFIGNETANGNVTRGLTMNQQCTDNQIFALKSSDVAHGMTNYAETDTYFSIQKAHGTGGAEIMSFGGGNNDFSLRWQALIGGCANTGKSTSSHGAVCFNARQECGVTSKAIGSDGNIMSLRDESTTRFLFDAEGTAHADVGTATYDDYNDVELLRGFLATTCDKYKANYQDRFGQDLMYNQQWYEDNKLIGKCSIHYETRSCGKVQQRAMVNMTGLTMLHHSTIIQMNDQLTARIDGLETQLKALQGGYK
jgi:hypothetical protein